MAIRYLWRIRPLIAVAAVGLGGPALLLLSNSDDVPLRLRLVGLVLASLIALTWEDRAAPLVTATPAGLPAVQRGRILLVLSGVAVAWGLTCLAASVRAPDVGGWWATLEVAALAALVTAIVGGLARARPAESLAAYPLPLLICLLLLATRLPSRWTLIAAPGSPAWQDAHQRWAVLLLLGLMAVAYVARDPATQPLRRHL